MASNFEKETGVRGVHGTSLGSATWDLWMLGRPLDYWDYNLGCVLAQKERSDYGKRNDANVA